MPARPPSDSGLRKAVWIYSGSLGLLLSVVKIVQHMAFQTQAWDLGIITNILWNTAHGRFFFDPSEGINHLGSHFSPVLILLVPFFKLWEGPEILMVIQSLALAVAVPAVYLLAESELGDDKAALGFALWFSLFPLFHYISRYDFHVGGLAVPILSWAVYFWRRKKMSRVAALLGFALLLQEDLALVAAGWGATMALSARRRDFHERAWGLGIGAVGVSAFVLEIGFLMPWCAPHWHPQQWIFYSYLGKTPWGMLRSLTHPAVFWKTIVADPKKAASVARLLLLSGALPLAALPDCLPLVVPLLIGLASGYADQYNFRSQYGATLLPFLFFAAIRGYARLRSSPWVQSRFNFGSWSRRYLPILTAVSLAFFPGYGHVGRLFHGGLRRIEAFRELDRLIPAQDGVSATTDLMPHLALRCGISTFPHAVPSRCGAAFTYVEPRWVFLDVDLEGWDVPMEYVNEQRNFILGHRGQLVAARDGFRLYHLP